MTRRGALCTAAFPTKPTPRQLAYTRAMRTRMIVGCAVALGALRCGGAGTAASSDSGSGCEQQLNGGLSIPQCTCAAMAASAPSGSTVVLVASTTSDKINGNYDLGLPAGTPVCFVAMTGQFTLPTGPSPGPSPVDASATTVKYSFGIYTESPWRLTEDGLQATQPTPGSE